MKITMEHKLNDEQKEEFKMEFEVIAEVLREELDQAIDGWKKMERNFSYAIVGTGVVAFIAGIALGKSLCQE